MPDNHVRAAVEHYLPVRAANRQRGLRQVLRPSRPVPSPVVVFVNAGAEESKLKPNGLVRDVTQAVEPRRYDQHDCDTPDSEFLDSRHAPEL
jgi:hypothetical protein